MRRAEEVRCGALLHEIKDYKNGNIVCFMPNQLSTYAYDVPWVGAISILGSLQYVRSEYAPPGSRGFIMSNKRTHCSSSHVREYPSFIELFLEILYLSGPFIVRGYVGKYCYPNAVPNQSGVAGSLELLEFPVSQYVQHSEVNNVVVIGIYNGKILYLDPRSCSMIEGKRQAFVMDAEKFIDGVVAAMRPVPNMMLELELEFNEQHSMGTTLDMMRAHTKLDLPQHCYSAYYNGIKYVDFRLVPSVWVRNQKFMVEYPRAHTLENTWASINGIDVLHSRIDGSDRTVFPYIQPLIELTAENTFLQHDAIDKLPLDGPEFVAESFASQIEGHFFYGSIYSTKVTGISWNFNLLHQYMMGNADQYVNNHERLDLSNVERPLLFFARDVDGVLKPVVVLPRKMNRNVLDTIRTRTTLQSPGIIDQDSTVSLDHSEEKSEYRFVPAPELSDDHFDIQRCHDFKTSQKHIKPAIKTFVAIDADNNPRFFLSLEESVKPVNSPGILHTAETPDQLTTDLIITAMDDGQESKAELQKFVAELHELDIYNGLVPVHMVDGDHVIVKIELSAASNDAQLDYIFEILKSQKIYPFINSDNVITASKERYYPKYWDDEKYAHIQQCIADSRLEEALQFAIESDQKQANKEEYVSNYCCYEYTYALASILRVAVDASAQRIAHQAFDWIYKYSETHCKEAAVRRAEIALYLAGETANANSEVVVAGRTKVVEACLFAASNKAQSSERTALLWTINTMSGRSRADGLFDKLRNMECVKQGGKEEAAVEMMASEIIGILATELSKYPDQDAAVSKAKAGVSDAQATQTAKGGECSGRRRAKSL